MTDPAEYRRLARTMRKELWQTQPKCAKCDCMECADCDCCQLHAARERVVVTIASALTEAAEMAERWERHRESCGGSQLSMAKACEELTAARDALYAEVRRLEDRPPADDTIAAVSALQSATAERDAARAEVERLRAGIGEALAKPPMILDERKDLMIMARLRKLLGDP